jgi:hypothetical protein
MGLGPRCLRITVGNRDYHHLSQFEIDGAKRISQHYPSFRQDLLRTASELPTNRPESLELGVHLLHPLPRRLHFCDGGTDNFPS